MNTFTPSNFKIEGKWDSRGFTFGLWSDHAGWTWTKKTHDADQIFVALTGELELEIDGSRFRAEIGEEIFIPAHVPHTIRNVGRKTARWMYGIRHLENR